MNSIRKIIILTALILFRFPAIIGQTKDPAVLITGGAGYIGSHTAYLMAQKGYKVIILDKLGHGQPFDHKWATLIKKDFSDEKTLNNIFSTYDIQAVIHFAAFIEVGESVKKPIKFYHNNVAKTITLLNIMLDHGVKKFIFSSSCAVYGDPIKLPLTEDHPKDPVSPYGKSKLMVETVLYDLSKLHDFKYVSLRYFNAAGAMPEYGLGERHDPETHLIPIIFRADKKKKPFYIFGTDYPTKDGSCVRDFIHVWDLAHAHWLAFDYLRKGNPSDCFNLGTGNGFSVKEIIKTAKRICGLTIEIVPAKRRAGDPPILVADPSKANKILKWKPTHSDIDNIIRSAYEFEKIK